MVMNVNSFDPPQEMVIPIINRTVLARSLWSFSIAISSFHSSIPVLQRVDQWPVICFVKGQFRMRSPLSEHSLADSDRLPLFHFPLLSRLSYSVRNES